MATSPPDSSRPSRYHWIRAILGVGDERLASWQLQDPNQLQ
jgi:hypothetical protein